MEYNVFVVVEMMAWLKWHKHEKALKHLTQFMEETQGSAPITPIMSFPIGNLISLKIYIVSDWIKNIKSNIETENQNILKDKTDKLDRVTAIVEITDRRYHTWSIKFYSARQEKTTLPRTWNILWWKRIV